MHLGGNRSWVPLLLKNSNKNQKPESEKNVEICP